jgi:predicted RNA-binding protein YlqC (UPF0109 family)
MSAEALRDLVAYLAQQLTFPETPIRVEAHSTASGALEIELYVPEKERGRVIGRQGRTADAIRAVLQAAARKHGLHVSLQLAEK